MEIYLDHLSGEREGALERFTGDVIRIGRSAECDLCFDDAGVSFEHAEVRKRDDGAFWVVDHGSTNGTFVNDERAHNARLKDGDLLRFGKKGPVVRFRASDGDPLLAKRAKAPGRPAASADAPFPAIGRRATSRFEDLRLEPGIVASPPRDPPPRGAAREAAAVAPAPSSSGSSNPARAGERRSLAGARPRESTRRGLLVPGALAVLLLGALGATFALYLEIDRRERQVAREKEARTAKERELDILKKSFDERLAEKAQSDRASLEDEKKRHERTAAELKQVQETLAKLEGSSHEKEDELKKRLVELEEELKVLRAKPSSGGGADTSTWKTLHKRVERSIVLIAVTLDGVRKKDRGRVQLGPVWGTGFVVSRDGVIATNKHVVQPWKFLPLAQKVAQEDLDVDLGSVQIHAWPVGARFIAGMRLELSTAFSTASKTLKLLRTAEDKWVPTPLPGTRGPRNVNVHDGNSNYDLALLKAEGSSFEPVPLRGQADGRIEKLDQVMAVGFPAGPQGPVLEKGIAETSPMLGQVRKIEETIYVPANMIGNVPGGPIVDDQGRVVGVATRVALGNEGGFGICLLVEHVIKLVSGSW